ncbi:TRAP transporter large permease [Jannaschia donghaensis]|uniref:Neu5Ac permease n=1 Tax=Jannaschia donghaensis TaxID=420998 RepID=A0A0M6YPS7_9RHOB|nr:TRAP transporter large permease [Jannaschia donghaensis]CTQ51016.1 Neu5Ac permease [Jannaschia donghaensis]
MDSIIDMKALLDGVDVFTTSLWLSGLLLVLVIIGVRVAFAAAFIGFVGLCLFFMQKQGFDKGIVTAMKTVGQIPHAKSTQYALSLIPTFILIGYLAYYAGLTRYLFEMAKRWVGWVPGGLGVATVFATAGFAAVSGASVATSAVFARIAIPEMLRDGYDKRFAAGVVAAGGTLASLIPPSAILVIYAIIVEQSVGKLLLAGFLPGMVSAVIYGGLVIILAKMRPTLGPAVGGYSWKERLESLPGAMPIFLVVFIIVYSIYFGWATPTEAGALGAGVVLVMAVWKGMRWNQLHGALMEAAKLTVMIFAMIWGVLIYVRYLGFAKLPDAFATFISGLEYPPYAILLCILLAYVVLGMFMDAIGMLILTLPVTFPAVMALNGGVGGQLGSLGMTNEDAAIWFGIIVVKMAELCLITPPIGLNCFVVAGVAQDAKMDISVSDVFRGASPFFIADVITVAVLVAFPGIVLFLPGLL